MDSHLWKNVHFSTFSTFCFYRLESCFLVIEYKKTHFPGLYCLKKAVGKRANFRPKPSTNPFGKNVNFSTFSTFCFCTLESYFFVLGYHKTHFPGQYCLKKKVGKMANFGPKPWTNPFGKMSIFRLFKLSVFVP